MPGTIIAIQVLKVDHARMHIHILDISLVAVPVIWMTVYMYIYSYMYMYMYHFFITQKYLKFPYSLQHYHGRSKRHHGRVRSIS